ncbi:MAG: hypothetical protein AB7N24_22485 [Dehalococcoidia bacterium]
MPKKRPEADQYPDPVGDRLRGMLAQAARPLPVEIAQPEPTATQPVDQDNGSTGTQKSPPARGPKRRQDERLAKSSEFLQQHKARFTAAEASANEEFMRALARALGTRPSQASVTRALWSLLRDTEESVQRTRTRNSAPKLNRPPNGFGVEMVEYERRLADYLGKLLKEPADL